MLLSNKLHKERMPIYVIKHGSASHTKNESNIVGVMGKEVCIMCCIQHPFRKSFHNIIAHTHTTLVK